MSPYGNFSPSYSGWQYPMAKYYNISVRQTIDLNAQLNQEAQSHINAKEPNINIWEIDRSDCKESSAPTNGIDKKGPSDEKSMGDQHSRTAEPSINANGEASSSSKPSKFITLKKAFSIKSTEERAIAKLEKVNAKGRELRNLILQEEDGRWPDSEWRHIVNNYQVKVEMKDKIAELRKHAPIQYLHMLRAGYFEPIPVAWANQLSNPLKFTVDARAGWRGITPTWRGYEDTAEERLYWVLNHRGGTGQRLKPDIISALNLARLRMASAVEPPPAYFAADDTCHVRHTSEGYSKQVMPAPFRPYDVPETSADNTVILLDVSGSMEFDPMRPIYDEYLITGYTGSNQPKNRRTNPLFPSVKDE